MTGRRQALPAEWASGEIAVLGLARSGMAVARALLARGARVYASDSSAGDELHAAGETLRSLGAAVDIGGHDLQRIASAAVVVASPGIPPSAPPIVAAHQARRQVVGEVEVALRLLPGLSYIAITGSNGKSTTTALAAHMLRGLGIDAAAAGNIGAPLVDFVDDPPAMVVLEVSSFQLHDTPGIAPAVGVLTNLSPNHLDRYASLEEYYGDKALLFRNATEHSCWVLNADDADSLRLAGDAKGRRLHFSLENRIAEAHLSGEELVVLGEVLGRREGLPLLGDHNVANVLAAALAVVAATGTERAAETVARIGESVAGFTSLEHRTEPVVEAGGVLWINDSKSTSIAATLVALRGMTRPTVLLLGGKHKGEPYTLLAPEIRRVVRTVLAYGEARETIARDLDGTVSVEALETDFAGVVKRARELAAPGDAVLLSPACSSYDMFRNYEERGAEFRRLVRESSDVASVRRA